MKHRNVFSLLYRHLLYFGTALLLFAAWAGRASRYGFAWVSAYGNCIFAALIPSLFLLFAWLLRRDAASEQPPAAAPNPVPRSPRRLTWVKRLILLFSILSFLCFCLECYGSATQFRAPVFNDPAFLYGYSTFRAWLVRLLMVACAVCGGCSWLRLVRSPRASCSAFFRQGLPLYWYAGIAAAADSWVIYFTNRYTPTLFQDWFLFVLRPLAVPAVLALAGLFLRTGNKERV